MIIKLVIWLFIVGVQCRQNQVYSIVIKDNDDVYLKKSDTIQCDNNSILCENEYKPTWDSLDKRPLPTWYDDAKFGIFIHWGVFSVPSFGSEWFWKHWTDEKGNGSHSDFIKQRYPPNFTYQDFGRDFTAEFYNATQWSEIFEASGAKYVVLTSKHHEGYTLWPSKYSFSWNSMDVGPRKDLIGELATAIRNNTNMVFGLYHSLFEWYNPLWLADQKANFSTNTFVTNKILPEMVELVNTYEPEILWSDGEWDAPDTYWRSKNFLAWLFNNSTVKDTIVVNDRWGHETMCHHGDFYTCADRYNPGVLQKHKWENAMTIDRRSWGYRRNAALKDFMSIKELVEELAVTVSCGGNMLMNVGPTKDGIIPPIYEERLRQMGEWLTVNGDAIYNTRPYKVQNDSMTGDTWYTASKDGKTIYAIVLTWPSDGTLKLHIVENISEIFLLGYQVPLKWSTGKFSVRFIAMPVDFHRGQPAWVLKIKTKESINDN